jgi:DNA repair protein RadC
MTLYDAIYESRRRASAACGCQKPQQAAPADGRVVWPGEMGAPRGRSERDERTSVDIDSAKGLGSGCRPWLKVERNEKYYEACMAIAEKIGPIDSSKKAFQILKEAVGSDDAESFGAMYLDTHLYLRGLAETGKGEYDAVMAPLKPTLRLAMQDGITGLLIYHCHPTLYSQPSDADKGVTKSFEDACVTLDLFFVDHLIIGGHKEYFSFADEGLLQDPK